MKKILLAMVIVFVLAATSGVAQADIISFIQALQGVDGDTSSWSTGDGLDTAIGPGNTAVNQWSLLGGTAAVNGFSGAGVGTLTHRGTRGLGIQGGMANDELDSISNLERIEITFNTAQYLNSLEVRSLFSETTGAEQGVVDFYLGASNVFTQSLVGTQTTGNGVASYAYAVPYAIDKLDFYVPLSQTYTPNSEFAVAKLDVNAVPEPISCALFMIGGISLISVGLNRRKR